MKKMLYIILIISLSTMCSSKPKEPVVLIQTSYGNIKVKLYNETPLHRDNFLKKADEGFYKDLTFHRVIKDFMIQGGDQNTRNGNINDMDSTENKILKDTIAAEFRFPQYFHKRGALAAARWGDAENPTKASDASQFYIVTGELRFEEKLNEIEKQRFERLKQSIYSNLQSSNMDTIKSLYKEGNRSAITELRNQWQEQSEKEANERKSEIFFTEHQREYYSTRGGAPHLDGEYTVFGEVIEGMDVVDKIQNVKTNEKDMPLSKVIMNIAVLEK